jgi:hypothetical protein
MDAKTLPHEFQMQCCQCNQEGQKALKTKAVLCYYIIEGNTTVPEKCICYM